MAVHVRKFCTSVSVLFAVLYVSSSPLHDFNLQFLFGSASNIFPTLEKVHRRSITGPILHIRVVKSIHYCSVAYSKNRSKLCRDGKLTVKKGVHLVVS